MTDQITTVEEFDALPVGTVLLDRDGWPLWRHWLSGWCAANGTRGVEWEEVERDGAPLSVLYRPDAAPAPRTTPADETAMGRDLVAEIRRLRAEVERLARWKAEALPVLSGLQDLGNALGVPLGQSITGPESVQRARDMVAALAASPADADTAERERLAKAWDEGRAAQADYTRRQEDADAAGQYVQINLPRNPYASPVCSTCGCDPRYPTGLHLVDCAASLPVAATSEETSR